jgi:hypothetical protein
MEPEREGTSILKLQLLPPDNECPAAARIALKLIGAYHKLIVTD